MHRSRGPGEQVSGSWGNSQRMFVKKEAEGGWGPKKGEGPQRPPLASSPKVSSGPPEAQAFDRNSHPLSFWLPPHPMFQQKLSLAQNCNPCVWTQVSQNQRPSLT